MDDEKPNSSDSPSSQEVVPSNDILSTYIKPQGRKPHDPDVTFEEYYYYAQRTREEEKTLESPVLNWREVVLRKKSGHDAGNKEPGAHTSLTEENFANSSNRLEISDEEWTNASRAYRTASWGACE
jgi:hypothetical protein